MAMEDRPQSSLPQRIRSYTLPAFLIILLAISLLLSITFFQMQFAWYIVFIPVLTLLLVLYALIRLGYSYNWTGFQSKTLWDWLQIVGIIAIPIVVAIASIWLSGVQNHDMQITTDQQQQTTLESYLDQMSSLLLDKNLSSPKSGDEVQVLARARTLTALNHLDPTRKGIILEFLYESHLIDRRKPIVNLRNADLSNVALSTVDLSNVDLSNANLSKANLMGDNLTNANLTNTNLENANLQFAILIDADLLCSGQTTYNSNPTPTPIIELLSWANLVDANLQNSLLFDVNARGAMLQYANLHGATLDGADLTNAQLNHADLSCTLRIGPKVPRQQSTSA